MSKKSGSIFVNHNDERIQLNTKIPKELKEKMDAIDEQLADINPKLKFDKNLIVENALRDAIQAAESEIKKMKSELKHHDDKKVTSAPTEIQSA